MNVIDSIRERLDSLQPQALEISDDSALHAGHAGAKDGGGHFRMIIVSEQFAGLSTIERHRLVYAALGPLMQRQIHAMSITALTPEEG